MLELNRQFGSPLWAALVVYGSGFVSVLLIQLLVRQHVPSTGRLGSVPLWAWAGGLISILPTLAGLTLAQRLGAGVFTGLSVTAALACSIALDHFGLLGFRRARGLSGTSIGVRSYDRRPVGRDAELACSLCESAC